MARRVFPRIESPEGDPREASSSETRESADAFLPEAQAPRARHDFRSSFEGLWTDRVDAQDEIDRRLRAGAVSDAEAELLREWVSDGFVVLQKAVGLELCEQLKAELRHAFEHGDSRLHVLRPGEHFGTPLDPGTEMTRARVNDIYVYFESARKALFSEPVERFLQLIFDAPPLLLQSLTFHEGSQQGVHQDTAFVVIDPPLAFAAAWIALEDIRPGTGELVYYRGSHRLPDYLFSGKYKCWHPERDGSDAELEYARQLLGEVEAAGLAKEHLLARQGDVLIWSADLAHGGSEVTVPGSTRESLVGHYCPSWAVPRYYDQFPDKRARRAFAGGFYSSTHYQV